MKSSDLKKMIKPLVRECLTEIFAEMRLESIVESVVQKRVAQRPTSRAAHEIVQPLTENNQTTEMTAQEQKAMLRERLGVGEDEWRNMYEGAVPPGNENDKPEVAPESALRKAGIFKDYSKFV